MKQRAKYFFPCIICALLLHINNIFSQTNKIEVLKMSLDKVNDASQKLDAALALCSQSHSLNADTLYYYAKLAKQLSVNLHDNKKNILSDLAMIIWLGRKNIFDSALKICNNDLKNISYPKDGALYTKMIMQKCYVLSKMAKPKDALDNAYHFLQQTELNDDTLSQIYCKAYICFNLSLYATNR